MIPYHPFALMAAMTISLVVHVMAAVIAAHVAAGTMLGLVALVMLLFPRGRQVLRRHYCRFRARALQ